MLNYNGAYQNQLELMGEPVVIALAVTLMASGTIRIVVDPAAVGFPNFENVLFRIGGPDK